MKAEVVKFVRHCDVAAYESVGWVDTKGLRGTHHGHHATIMKWANDDEPPAEPTCMMEKPCA